MYALEKTLMTLVEFDSKMYFLKLSNDPENGTENFSEELKIVQLLVTLIFCLLRSH